MTLSYFDLTAIVAPVPPDWNGVSELQNGPPEKAHKKRKRITKVVDVWFQSSKPAQNNAEGWRIPELLEELARMSSRGPHAHARLGMFLWP